MARYDEKFKLSVVQDYESGKGGFQALAKLHGLDHATVRGWVKRYQHHGVAGLRKKFSHYSAPFKLAVLQRIQRDQLSAHQAVALFDIRGGIGVISTWERQYHGGGLDALTPKRRGRSPKMPTPRLPKQPPPQSDDSRSREQLLQENAYLRTEVAYLKKLAALLQVKARPAQKKRG
jgi:transposase